VTNRQRCPFSAHASLFRNLSVSAQSELLGRVLAIASDLSQCVPAVSKSLSLSPDGIRIVRMLRRNFIKTLGASIATGAAGQKPASGQERAHVSYRRSHDAVVVGAGVFGAWTAYHLQQAGKKVLLMDA